MLRILPRRKKNLVFIYDVIVKQNKKKALLITTIVTKMTTLSEVVGASGKKTPATKRKESPEAVKSFPALPCLQQFHDGETVPLWASAAGLWRGLVLG